jgi:hypothetical protein
MKKNCQVTIAAVLLGLFFVGGCMWGFAPAIGKYEQDPATGAMSKDYPKSMQETWNATLAADQDIKLKISKQQFGPQESLLEGVETPLWFQLDVKVQLLSGGDQNTTVKVIYGPPTVAWAIDLEIAKKEFHSKIMQHLGMPTSTELYVRPGI